MEAIIILVIALQLPYTLKLHGLKQWFSSQFFCSVLGLWILARLTQAPVTSITGSPGDWLILSGLTHMLRGGLAVDSGGDRASKLVQAVTWQLDTKKRLSLKVQALFESRLLPHLLIISCPGQSKT
jgi:hypothetical protein